MRYFIGIDPGKTGAIAIITDDGREAVYDFGPEALTALSDLWARKRAVEAMGKEMEVFAMVEKPFAGSPEGRKQGATSMLNYGAAYGQAKGWLEAYCIPFEEVHPATWKAKMGMRGKDKEFSRAKAMQIFPALAGTRLKRKLDHNRAEALLLAEYLRRQRVYREAI